MCNEDKVNALITEERRLASLEHVGEELKELVEVYEKKIKNSKANMDSRISMLIYYMRDLVGEYDLLSEYKTKLDILNEKMEEPEDD